MRSRQPREFYYGICVVSWALSWGLQHRKVGKRKTIVIVAEGAHDSSLAPIKADDVKDVLSEKLGLDTRVTTLGHTQRGGRPCYYDRVLVGRVIPLSGISIDQLGFSPPCKPWKRSIRY